MQSVIALSSMPSGMQCRMKAPLLLLGFFPLSHNLSVLLPSTGDISGIHALSANCWLVAVVLRCYVLPILGLCICMFVNNGLHVQFHHITASRQCNTRQPGKGCQKGLMMVLCLGCVALTTRLTVFLKMHCGKLLFTTHECWSVRASQLTSFKVVVITR